ncbi:DUF6352 family protein [Alsobacter sp. KACC 23698]|uniref:DUF6352 family protein n=1 Tax=Alsobacter sp. KACC 23698 TaxID=3149229 RepID=A0AAU7JHT2_9HYPH
MSASIANRACSRDDFWISSGHQMLDREETGWAVVTDEFLKLYLARPELAPPVDACPAERALHASLLAGDPRRPVAPAEVDAIQDEDARENWAVMLTHRDRLVTAGCVEGAYLAAVTQGGAASLFLDQWAQIILRGALDTDRSPLVLRAAELLFRPQRIAFHAGGVLLADDELVSVREAAHGASPLARMLLDAPETELDVLGENDERRYLARSDAFDFALPFEPGGPGHGALATAMTSWLRHLLRLDVSIRPVRAIDDPVWRWSIGLNAAGVAICEAAWRGEAVDPATVLGLFRLDLSDWTRVLPRMAGQPIWLILGMDDTKVLRIRPQNLITGLPLLDRQPEEADGRPDP